MPFLLLNQQRQSTEGSHSLLVSYYNLCKWIIQVPGAATCIFGHYGVLFSYQNNYSKLEIVLHWSWFFGITCPEKSWLFILTFERKSSVKGKGKGTPFKDYILTKSVTVEAVGFEQLAQSRYAAAPGCESNSRPLDRKSDALPWCHHATPSSLWYYRDVHLSQALVMRLAEKISYYTALFADFFSGD